MPRTATTWTIVLMSEVARSWTRRMHKKRTRRPRNSRIRATSTSPRRNSRKRKFYDDALALSPPPVGRLAAVLLANRAQALLSRAAVADATRLDRAATFAALRDAASCATEARAADETYDKAWYRLGLANLELAKRCRGGGKGAPLPDEVMNRLRDSVKALSKAARLSPKVKAMRDAHKECKTMLEVTEACVNEARLPPCYDKVPPVVASGKGIDARASTTIPVSRLRSGVVEATVELPVLFGVGGTTFLTGVLALGSSPFAEPI